MRLKRWYLPLSARAVGWAARGFVMRVRNISVRDRNAVLLHRRNVRERYSGCHPVKPGKADAPGWILNHVPVQVHQRTARADLRDNVFVAEKAVESGVGSRLCGDRIGTS